MLYDAPQPPPLVPSPWPRAATMTQWQLLAVHSAWISGCTGNQQSATGSGRGAEGRGLCL